MSNDDEKIRPDSSASFEEDICIHIFSASATLLGVCLTVIGIIRVVITSTHVNTFADDIVACGAVIFMLCCFTSYWAIRARSVGRMRRLEKIADTLFLLGLCLLAVACMFITYAIV
ncbi:MAG: hypothetical protein PW788_16020 [Micavibrio sp.]|nr:hypothetical protein [Micavibrio sp.]